MSDLNSRQEVEEVLKQVYCDVERYQGYPITSKQHKIFMQLMNIVEEIEDLESFASDIISLRDNYNNISPYYCEDLEFDFFTFMEKWSKKIEHYKWGGEKLD